LSTVASAQAPPADPAPTAPIFGRAETVETVVRKIQDARAARGGFVVVVGESGVGKSILLRHLERLALGLGYGVVHGRALPADLPQPFALLGDVVRSAGESRPSTLESGESADGSILPMFLAPFGTEGRTRKSAATPAEESHDGTEANRLLTRLENPVERVQANRAALFAQLTDFLLQLATDRPLLVSLDDLAFADDSSLEFLQQFSGAIADSRVVVVGSSLPLANAPARAQTALERLVDSPDTTRLSLRPMAEPDVASYVRWLLNGRDPGRDAVMRWFTQTEGNPLFLEHLVRASMGSSRAGSTPSTSPSSGSSSTGPYSARSSTSRRSSGRRARRRSGSARASTGSCTAASSGRRAGRSTSS
jgi:energy-coupling factor transporter ATP-binding protein EcfA2